MVYLIGSFQVCKINADDFVITPTEVFEIACFAGEIDVVANSGNGCDRLQRNKIDSTLYIRICELETSVAYSLRLSGLLGLFVKAPCRIG